MNRMKRLLVPALFLACFSAHGLTAVIPKEPWWVGVTFEDGSARLSDQLQQELRAAIDEIPSRCSAYKPATGRASVEYSIAPSSMPRSDYPLIGARVEALRKFLVGFRPMRVSLSIEAEESPNVTSLDGRADHLISVRFNCY
jgi:hypothetical protein